MWKKTINLEIIQCIATKVAHDIKGLECLNLDLTTLQVVGNNVPF